MENKKIPADILLVDDSPSDIRLINEMMDFRKLRASLHTVNSGAAAISFLRRENEYADKPQISLVLLDLNMRGKTGLEVLAEIKSDPALKNIPVIILTTSSLEADIVEAYKSHANCYLVKPMDLVGFERVVKAIENFWLTEVLPDGK